MKRAKWMAAATAGAACFGAAMMGPGCTTSPPPADEGCQSNADCDDGVFCNGEEVCQPDGTCAAGTPCETPTCPDCVCNETLKLCTMIPPCTGDGDCDDGLFCNGPETCVNGGCVDGEPVDCGEDACDEEIDACEVCLCVGDADCDDGAMCNGVETCVDCACQPGEPLCQEGEDCDELTGECSVCACASDEDCNDGLVCNGEETCADCLCVAGESPCIVENPRTGEPCDSCNEQLGGCLAPCVSDEECNDGQFCNGQEVCDGCSCLPGAPPCPEGACDEGGDVCLE